MFAAKKPEGVPLVGKAGFFDGKAVIPLGIGKWIHGRIITKVWIYWFPDEDTKGNG